MCVFTHFAAGALLGSLLPSPVYMTPLLGMGSHVLLDVLPHRDIDDYRIEIFLWVLTMAVLFTMGAHTLSIIICSVAAVLPDLENLLWKLGKLKEEKKIFPGHRGIIPHGKKAGPLNLVIQGVFTVLAVAYLIRRHG